MYLKVSFDNLIKNNWWRTKERKRKNYFLAFSIIFIYIYKMMHFVVCQEVVRNGIITQNVFITTFFFPIKHDIPNLINKYSELIISLDWLQPFLFVVDCFLYSCTLLFVLFLPILHRTFSFNAVEGFLTIFPYGSWCFHLPHFIWKVNCTVVLYLYFIVDCFMQWIQHFDVFILMII